MTAMSDRRNYDEGVARTLRPYPQRTLLDYLRENAARWPSRRALFFKGATTTYADLIKTSGYQVWSREIEEVISAHPTVHDPGVETV